MRTKDDYIYMHKLLYKRSYGHVEDFVKLFDLEKYKTIVEIIDRHKNFSHEKWEVVYENNKKDIAVLLTLLNTKMCPTDIVSKMLNEIEFAKDTSSGRIKYESYEQRSLIANIINYDLCDKDLQFIFDIDGNGVLNLFDTYSCNLKKEIDIPQHNVEKIAEYYCGKFTDGKFNRYRTPKELLPLTYVKNDDVVRKIVMTNPLEMIITQAINNPHISEKLKNELFELGPRYENISEFTFDTACSMYETAIETFDEAYDEKTKTVVKGFANSYWDAKCVISQLLKTHSLPPSLEMDFAKRIVNRKDRSQDQLTADLFRYTKNPDILRLAPEIKSKDKEIAYKNEYMPADVLKSYVEKMCDKMIKLTNANKRNDIPGIWYEHIKNAVPRIKLDDKHYDIILNTGGESECIAIAQSPYTPEHILKSLITTFDLEKYNMRKNTHSEKVKFSAQLNLFFRNNDIDNATKSSIYKFIQDAPYNVSYDESHETNKRPDARYSYAIQSLASIVKYQDKKSYKKIKTYIDELAKTFKINESSDKVDPEIKHKKYYSNFVNFVSRKFSEIENNFLSEERAKDYNLPVGFLSDNEIKMRLSKISSEYSECSYEHALLASLHKLEDAFFETVEEIKKHDELKELLKTEEELEKDSNADEMEKPTL